VARRVLEGSVAVIAALKWSVSEIGRKLGILMLLLTLLAVSACQSLAGTCAIERQANVPVDTEILSLPRW
jgi:hypothetical protein